MGSATVPNVISLYLIGQVLFLLRTCYSQCFDAKILIISNYGNSSVPGFNLLTNANMGMCMMVCYKFTLCRSVDWIREEKKCHLNTRFDIKNVSRLMFEDRIIRVYRENFPKHLLGDCLNHSCTEDAICISGNCVPVLKEKIYKDCSAILKRASSKRGQDGVYVIYADTRREVFCDMTTDEGGWTVIQKREDGDVDFYRTWKDYKHGFGNASKNYWIHVGNDAVRALTRDQNQELRVYLKRYNGEQAYAKYTTFYIGDENNKYTITVSGYSGTASDSLAYHNGMRFSTYDQKNDNAVEGSCAIEYRGGWWYNWCHKSNLNGEYALSPVIGPKYPTWLYWKNTFEALQKTVIMIRHKN